MKKRKLEKGITLIALIITIVVLLILAIVTIGAVQESGIIGHAQKASNDYTIAQEKEQIELGHSEYLIEKYISDNAQLEVEGAQVTGSEKAGWKVVFNETNNTYQVDKDGSITYVESEEEDTEASLLEKYILGADLGGRDLYDIIDAEGFVDETETIADASTSITYHFQSDDATTSVWYIKYDNNIYKFALIVEEGEDDYIYTTDPNYGVVTVYEPEEGTRVGQTVKYDDKLWTILYDDSTNGLQMISNETFLYNEDEFYLGFSDSSVSNWDSLISVADLDKDGSLTNFEKAVYSYNNVINTLNTACESLVTSSSNITSVRSVGSNPVNKNSEDTDKYESDNLEIWPIDNATYSAGIGNGIGKKADTNYMSDYERMIALEILNADHNYWIASRFIDESSSSTSVYFEVRYASSYIRSDSIWTIRKNDVSLYGSNAIDLSSEKSNQMRSLRPVVTLKSDIQFSGSGTEADPYTFN